MRVFFGYFGASLLAAVVTAAWVALFAEPGVTLTGSFPVPDVVGAWSPLMAVSWRQALLFHASSGQPLSFFIDMAVGLPLFLIFDLPGRLLFGVVDSAWNGEDEWEKIKPVWSAVIYGVTATIVVLGCRRFGLPPFDRVLVPYHVLVGAAVLAGLLAGFGSMLRAADSRYS